MALDGCAASPGVVFPGVVFHTESLEETWRLAAALAAELEPGCFVGLDGDLGAGKTTFVQGLCRVLEVVEPVASPTFVLLRVYRGHLTVYHFDAYRLESAADLDDLGADEYFWGDGVSLVEWAERVVEALPPDRLDLRIEVSGEDSRRLAFVARGPRHGALLDRLQRRLAGSSVIPESEVAW